MFSIPLIRVQEPVKLTAEQITDNKGFRLRTYIEPKAVPIGLAIMLSYLCYSSVSSFLALYSEAIHLTTAAGVFFIVYAVMIFLSRPHRGTAVRHQGRELGDVRGVAVFALGLAVLAVAAHAVVLLLAAAIWGSASGPSRPADGR